MKDLILEADPRKHGIDASIWNTKELREHFRRSGRSISSETIRRCLREMGARYVNARQAYSETDRKAWKDFVRVLISTMNYDPNVIYSIFEQEIPMSLGKNCGWTFEKRIARGGTEQDMNGEDSKEGGLKKEPPARKIEKNKEIEPLLRVSKKD